MTENTAAATVTKTVVKPAPRSSVLADWKFREGVTEGLAHMFVKRPTLHHVDTRCLRDKTTASVISLADMKARFADSVKAENEGEIRPTDFCTRCLITMPSVEVEVVVAAEKAAKIKTPVVVDPVVNVDDSEDLAAVLAASIEPASKVVPVRKPRTARKTAAAAK